MDKPESYDERVARLEAAKKKKGAPAKISSVVASVAQALEDSLKPLGHYNIPALLDQRRLEYAIPNGAFEIAPVFDRIYVWQVPEHNSQTFDEGGMILKPEHTQSVQRRITPRGILVSAGLQAMDSLYSAGIEIGHFVKFQKMSPFEMTIETISGNDLKVMVMRDGDIVGSEDIATMLNNGATEVENVSQDGYDFRFSLNGTKESTGKKASAYFDPSY